MKSLLPVLLLSVLLSSVGHLGAQVFFDANGSTSGFGAYTSQSLDGNLWSSDNTGSSVTTDFATAGGTTASTTVFTVGESTFTGNSQSIETGMLLSWEIGSLTWRSDIANPSTTSRNNVGLNGNGKQLIFAPGATVEVQDIYTTNVVDLTMNNFAIVNDFTKTGAGGLQWRSGMSLDGTATIAAGSLRMETGPNLGLNSRINVLSGGEFAFQYAGGPGGLTTVSIGGLSGDGLVSGGTGNTTATNRLTILDGHGLDFSGTIDAGAGNLVSVQKSGAGTQTFSGANTYDGTTTVSGGTLLVTGTHTGAGAYTVDGGVLGGSGSITTSNASVTVNGTGQLAPGTDGTIDTLNLSLGSGSLDLSNVGPGSLLFDLDAAGDLIAVNAGVDISGLEFGDFVFSDLGGVTTTTYTLITSTGLTGSLGATTTGSFGSWSGELLINGNNLELNVVPEPAVTLLFMMGLGAVLFTQRRRVRASRVGTAQA